MVRRGPPPPSDPDKGIWQGTSVARIFTSPDGMLVLVGRSAADNDLLTFGNRGLDIGAPLGFQRFLAEIIT